VASHRRARISDGSAPTKPLPSSWHTIVMSEMLASAGRGEPPPGLLECQAITGEDRGSVGGWCSEAKAQVEVRTHVEAHVKPIRRVSVCSIASMSSCASIMQRVEEKISSGAAESELLGVDYLEPLPSSSRLAPRHGLVPGARVQLAGAGCCTLSLRALLVSALVATAALSCGAMLVMLELAVGAARSDVLSGNGGGLVVARGAAAAVALIAVVASLALGLCLGAAVVRPIVGIGRLVELLSEPDLARRAAELNRLRAGRCSWIRDVSELQDAFSRLSQVVEMFMRYVPDTVVRSIVRGDENAMRLHVSKRRVTIMFSDIEDFTAISESLSQEDLLYVLTRYLSIVTKLVESYQGVVAEILGDGLLVFWNTPDAVPGHEAKACAAAMAQQQVLVALNIELARLKMPKIATRIGLHTGRVLSGTIGSETKMKFGCLGDPVNLASRLESLCKVYGVSVLCSGETYDALPKDGDFLCRQLDLVQVRGKRTATRIYEVVGVTNHHACLERGRLKFAAETAMQASTKGLGASNVLQVNPIRHQHGSFFKLGPLSPVEFANSSAESSVSVMPPAASMGSTGSARLWDMMSPEALKHVELYERALKEYQQAHFVVARGLLLAYLDQLPEDRAATLLLERACRYISPESGGVVGLTAAELAAWTGVTVMNEK